MMPVEHEYKFLLSSWGNEQLGALSKEHGGHFLSQGYLAGGRECTTRIRSVSLWPASGTGDISTDYWFTWKKRMDKGRFAGIERGGLMELEMPISTEDFADLWQECLYTLCKVRVRLPALPDRSGETWDVDFFMRNDCNDVVLCIAEVELDVEDAHPPLVHPVLSGYAQLIPLAEQHAFTSWNLSHPGNLMGISEYIPPHAE